MGSIWSNAVCVLGWLVIVTGSQKVAVYWGGVDMEQRCLCTGVGSIWSNAVCVLGWLVIITGSQKVAKNTEQRCLCTGVGSICGLKSVPEIILFKMVEKLRQHNSFQEL